MELTFEWDNEKADSNFNKHGISFEEAVTTFSDPLSITVQDFQSSTEERFVMVGESAEERLLVIVYTERGDNHIRIISAREATRHERKNYEKGT